MFWVINDIIKFDPDKNKLSSLSDAEVGVTLTAPASRCLSVLLEYYPNVVSQKELISRVWGEDGMIVPVNTLYQNISIVRRGLRTAGGAEDVLVSTVPRKGFRIDNSIKVARREAEVLPFEVVNIDHINQGPEETEIKETIKVTEECPPFIKKRLTLSLVAVLASFITGVATYNFLIASKRSPDYFDSYPILKIEEGCHFISNNNDINNKGNFSKYKRMITKTGLDCKKYSWIYFSSSSPAPALSAIVCKQPYKTTSGKECVTLYFREAVL
ncbi:transcriptional regulator [Enterobacter chuandaensis]|uniref:winged helix-turn-helix domain-containing protein n=1 Tax=Enterobacter chuandaensis TaxID=2497875 RepID=UPI002FD1A441